MKYRQFEPFPDEEDDDHSEVTQVSASDPEKKPKAFWKRSRGKGKGTAQAQPKEKNREKPAKECKEKPAPVEKPVPVIFFDEAHKLYVLCAVTKANPNIILQTGVNSFDGRNEVSPRRDVGSHETGSSVPCHSCD